LVAAVFGTAIDSRAPKIGGFGIGLTVQVDILVGGPLTGASMNPAQTFGPGLFFGKIIGCTELVRFLGAEKPPLFTNSS